MIHLFLLYWISLENGKNESLKQVADRKMKINCVEKRDWKAWVVSIEVTAESLRMMGCPNKRDESTEGQTLNLSHCGSVRGEREDRRRERGKEPSKIMSWEFKSFMTEWVVNKAKCNREINSNKNKRLLNLIRKRSNTSLLYQSFEIFVGSL